VSRARAREICEEAGEGGRETRGGWVGQEREEQWERDLWGVLIRARGGVRSRRKRVLFNFAITIFEFLRNIITIQLF